MTPQPATQAKPLVLCADDYAQSAGISQAIRDLAQAGRLSATSAMVLSPRWPEDAAALHALRGRIDVGLHVSRGQPGGISGDRRVHHRVTVPARGLAPPALDRRLRRRAEP